MFSTSGTRSEIAAPPPQVLLRRAGVVDGGRVYTVAADVLRRSKVIAAAVIYDAATTEPSFSFTQRGKTRVEFLYRKGSRVPLSLASSLSEYTRSAALSWAVVTAHADCPPEKALELAVVRAVERWVCRLTTAPRLEETRLYLRGNKLLSSLPSEIEQVTSTKDWRVEAARALCHYYDLKESENVAYDVPAM